MASNSEDADWDEFMEPSEEIKEYDNFENFNQEDCYQPKVRSQNYSQHQESYVICDVDKIKGRQQELITDVCDLFGFKDDEAI